MMNFKSVSIKALLFGATGLALLSTQAFALDFQYTFENLNGDVGSPTDIVTGRILGLNDNSFNFQPVTVTLDSVSPSIDPAFKAYTWTDFGLFFVLGGNMLFQSWSSNDGSYAINLDTFNAPFVATSDFTKYYLGGEESLIITPLSSVPDGGSTQILLGVGLVGLALLHRKLA
jgi:hypothetical protein